MPSMTRTPPDGCCRVAELPALARQHRHAFLRRHQPGERPRRQRATTRCRPAKAPARVTMIDPNIRPGFITDEADLPRPDRTDDGTSRHREAVGRRPALAARARATWRRWPAACSRRGPKVVFITEGAKGARAVTATQDRFVAATKVTVADTVGAGDTFNAGVLAALHAEGALTKTGLAGLSDHALDAALSLGTRAAAITVSRPGANPPWSHEL